MKKLIKSSTKIALMLLFVIFSNHSFAKVAKQDLNEIFTSSKFVTLSKTFSIDTKNIDLNNFEETIISNHCSIYRFKIIKNDHNDFLTVVKKQGVDFMFLYEKNNLDENQNGYLEQYDEKGNFLLDFKVMKENNGKFSINFNDLLISKRLGLDSTFKLDSVAESWIQCVKRIHDVIENACDQSEVCSISCDLSPNCEMYMYAVAAARCTADR